MDDALLVCGFERVGDLRRDRERLVQRKARYARARPNGTGPLRDEIGKRRTFDELQDERVHITGILEAIDGADVLMIERGEDLRFSLEASEPFDIEYELRWEYLQSDVAIEFRIARPIHLTHSAGSDGGNDFIRAEPRAGRQWQSAPVIIAILVRVATKAHGSVLMRAYDTAAKVKVLCGIHESD
jgi:hypothetical protein